MPHKKVRDKIMDVIICFFVPYSIFNNIENKLKCSHKSPGRDIGKLFAGLILKRGTNLQNKKNKNHDFLKFMWH